jgi:hypothetical protein
MKIERTVMNMQLTGLARWHGRPPTAVETR